MSVSKKSSKPPTYGEIDRDIFAHLDLESEYESFGIRFAGIERHDGIISCYAIDRDEKSASAWVNVQTGRYGDSGSKDPQLVTSISFYEFAARFGKLNFADYRVAREHYGQKCGVEVPKTKAKSKSKAKMDAKASGKEGADGNSASDSADGLSPAEKLAFLPNWPPDPTSDQPDTLSWLVDEFCTTYRPGLTTAAIIQAGGKLADWPRYRNQSGDLVLAPNSQKVIALPIFGPSDPTHPASPIVNPGEPLPAPTAWTIYALTTRHLSVYRGKDQPRELNKKLTIGPARGTLANAQALAVLADPIKRENVTAVWKTAGESDMIALMSIIPEPLRDVQLVTTNASGEGGNVLPCQVETLAGIRTIVIHDADATGEIGAKKWIDTLAFVSKHGEQEGGFEVKQIRLPYVVTDNHGKDLRDWINERLAAGKTSNEAYGELCDMAIASEIHQVSEQDAERIRKDFERIKLKQEVEQLEAAEIPTTPQAAARSAMKPPQAGSGDKPLHIGRVVDEDNGDSYELANYYFETVTTYKNGKKVTSPQIKSKTAEQIAEDILTRTGTWPKHADDSGLFIDAKPLYGHAAHKIRVIPNSTELSTWLKIHFGTTDWRGGSDCVKFDELFCILKSKAERFTSIEYNPHQPPIPGIYYACEMPDPPAEIPEYEITADNSAGLSPLDRLVSYFSPGTPDVDDALIKTLILTTFWGTSKGKPAFIITSSSQGQGVGKTTLVEILAGLCGTPDTPEGYIDFHPSEEMRAFKERLFSDIYSGVRTICIDNLKSHGFSWGELEAMITRDTIHGRKMYVGGVRKPNTFVWCITVNGPAMSRDMAERCITIELAPPPQAQRETWRAGVESYIENHRAAIISDIIAHLRRRPGIEGEQVKPRTRWAKWEKLMLQHFTNPDEIQDVIQSRLDCMDSTADEIEMLTEAFSNTMKTIGYDPLVDMVCIPTVEANAIAIDALKMKRDQFKTAGGVLRQYVKEGKLLGLINSPSHKHTRGYVWIGERDPADPRLRVQGAFSADDFRKRFERWKADQAAQRYHGHGSGPNVRRVSDPPPEQQSEF